MKPAARTTGGNNLCYIVLNVAIVCPLTIIRLEQVFLRIRIQKRNFVNTSACQLFLLFTYIYLSTVLNFITNARKIFWLSTVQKSIRIDMVVVTSFSALK